MEKSTRGAALGALKSLLDFSPEENTLLKATVTYRFFYLQPSLMLTEGLDNKQRCGCSQKRMHLPLRQEGRVDI